LYRRENEMDISIDDLMESDKETMGIYLMILHCRFNGFGFVEHLFEYSNPSIEDVLSVYFGTSSPEELEKVKNTMVEFNNRLKENSALKDAFIAKDPNRFKLCFNTLEDLEARYFEEFKEVFRNYVRLDTIPEGYRDFVKEFLKLIHNGAISGVDSTRMGSICLWRNNILVTAEELRGRVGKFIDILRKSRLAHRKNPEQPISIIVSSAAAALVNEFR